MLSPTRLLTTGRLSEAFSKAGLNVPVRTINRRLNEGVYPAIQHGREWIIDRADVPRIVEIERQIGRARRVSAGFLTDTSAASASVAA